MDFVRRGERHNQAKLTDDQVREIRRLRAAGVKLATLSRQFGTSTGNVSDIVIGKTWRHLLPPPSADGRIHSYCGRLERPHEGHVWTTQPGRWCPGDEVPGRPEPRFPVDSAPNSSEAPR